MQDYFYEIAKTLQSLLRGGEVFTCSFSGESSDFVRFNRNEVRQAGSVEQRVLSLDLIEGERHASGTLTLSGARDIDRPRLAQLVKNLRDQRAELPEDPFLLYATEVRSSERVMENRLPDGHQAVEDIRRVGQKRDLVGLFTSGGIYAGFASSLGQRNWYSNFSYNLDFSFYHELDKAVKTAYAGFAWEESELSRKVSWAAEQLGVLAHRPHTLPPGRYRVYLAPAALYELIRILSWGGFSLKSHQTKQTPFLHLIEGKERLHPSLRLIENTLDGVAPNFQEAGFIRPEVVPLIHDGEYRDCLVSPRSAREYGVPTNGASSDEAPLSVEVGAGEIRSDEILKHLDTGIFINNLHYLNFSDRAAGCTTGMTRFATFWVENGKIQAPLNVMRFDESIYRVLGDRLLGLTAEREMILDSSTYYGRSTMSGRVPGGLVDDFRLTL